MIKQAPAPAPPAPSPPVPARKRPFWLAALRLVGLLVFLAAFGFGVYTLTRFVAPNGWRPATGEGLQGGLDRVRELIDARERELAEQREEVERALTRSLQDVKDEASAREALMKCFIKGGSAVQVGMLEAQAELTPNFPDLKIREDLRNRKKLSETSEALIVEIKRVAAKYPGGFRAANEEYLDIAMPNRIKPPRDKPR